MRVFQWTDEIIEHLEEHDVTPEEFEEAFDNILWEEPSRSSGLSTIVALVRGRTLRCIYRELGPMDIEPVTALVQEVDW